MANIARTQIGTFNLGDVSDVTIGTPVVDQVLKYNGTNWVPGPQTSSSASNGVDFYLDDTNIIPASSENLFEVNTLTSSPVITTEVIDSKTITNTTAIVEAYLFNTALNRTQLDAGVWWLSTYARIDSTTGSGTAEVITAIKYVIPDAVNTITITGSGTSRTATASGGTPFISGDANADITLAGYLQTPKGVYQITAWSSSTVVTIAVPSAYVNESAVAFSTWKHGFLMTTGNITSTSLSLYEPDFVEAQISTSLTDKLAAMYFAKSTYTLSKTISFSHNGNSHYSWFHTPLVTLHDNLAGLYGTSATEVYGHISASSQTIYGTKTFNSAPILSTTTTGGQILYTNTGGSKDIVGSDNLLWDATRFYVTNAGTPGSSLDLFRLTNTANGNVDTVTSFNFYQKPRFGATTPLYSASIEAKTMDHWDTGTPTTIDSQIEFYAVSDNIKTLMFIASPGGWITVRSSLLSTTYASLFSTGQIYLVQNSYTAQIANQITLGNIYSAASMIGTGSSIHFMQQAYGGNYEHSGKVIVSCETNWTSTASTRDSQMYFQVLEDGALGTALTLASSKVATFVNTINVSRTSGSSISSFLNLTETVGSNIIIEHNQNSGTRYYSGSSYKRSSTEYWFVGMNDGDDSYHIKDAVSGIDAIKITTSTDAIDLYGNVTMPNLTVTYAGTLKAVTNFLTLNNTGGAADNDGTGTAIYAKQAASDLNLYDCGKMYWATEIDWTSTASTRDASLYFQVALNGTLTTKLQLSSSSVYISNSSSGSNEFSFNNNGVETVWMEIDSKSNSYQSMLRFKKNGTARWDITSRNAIDSPNDRLAFYSGTTQIMYLGTGGGLVLSVGGVDIAGTYTTPSDGGYYLGTSTVDGTWLISRSGNNLIFSRRESGSYVTKSTISA